MTGPTTALGGRLAELVDDMNKQIPEQLLPHIAKPEHVAHVLHTSVDALAQDRYRRRGLPWVKIAGRVRYLRADVLKHLAENRVTGDAA